MSGSEVDLPGPGQCCRIPSATRLRTHRATGHPGGGRATQRHVLADSRGAGRSGEAKHAGLHGRAVGSDIEQLHTHYRAKEIYVARCHQGAGTVARPGDQSSASNGACVMGKPPASQRSCHKYNPVRPLDYGRLSTGRASRHRSNPPCSR